MSHGREILAAKVGTGLGEEMMTETATAIEIERGKETETASATGTENEIAIEIAAMTTDNTTIVMRENETVTTIANTTLKEIENGGMIIGLPTEAEHHTTVMA
jgi:hypothetical protein